MSVCLCYSVALKCWSSCPDWYVADLPELPAGTWWKRLQAELSWEECPIPHWFHRPTHTNKQTNKHINSQHNTHTAHLTPTYRTGMYTNKHKIPEKYTHAWTQTYTQKCTLKHQYTHTPVRSSVCVLHLTAAGVSQRHWWFLELCSLLTPAEPLQSFDTGIWTHRHTTLHLNLQPNQISEDDTSRMHTSPSAPELSLPQSSALSPVCSYGSLSYAGFWKNTMRSYFPP